MDHNDKLFEKAKSLHQKDNISGAIKLYEKGEIYFIFSSGFT